MLAVPLACCVSVPQLQLACCCQPKLPAAACFICCHPAANPSSMTAPPSTCCPAAPATTAGVTASRKRPTEAAPRRESSRIRGIAADGSQVHSERQGEVGGLLLGCCPAACCSWLAGWLPAPLAVAVQAVHTSHWQQLTHLSTTSLDIGQPHPAAAPPLLLPHPAAPAPLPLQVVIVAGEVIRRYAPGTMTEEQAPQERHPLGELPFQSSNRGPHTDEAFIQLLAHAAAAASSSGSGSGGDSSGNGGSKKARRGGSGGAKQVKGALLGAAGMARLQLAEDDVAKVNYAVQCCAALCCALKSLPCLLTISRCRQGELWLWHSAVCCALITLACTFP